MCRSDRDVWRDQKDRVRVCTLRDPATVAGFSLAGDNYTHFHDNGVPYQTTLAKPHTLSNPGGVTVECAADFAVLDREGRVERCALARATRFGDVAARAGGHVAFRSDGSLWVAVIDTPITVLGARIAAGSRVGFHPSGRVANVYLEESAVVSGVPIRGEFTLHENGALASFTLAENHRVGGREFQAFAEVWLYEDGSLWHVEFVADRGFMIHGEPWTDTRKITFDCSGAVTSDRTEHYQAKTAPPRLR